MVRLANEFKESISLKDQRFDDILFSDTSNSIFENCIFNAEQFIDIDLNDVLSTPHYNSPQLLPVGSSIDG